MNTRKEIVIVFIIVILGCLPVFSGGEYETGSYGTWILPHSTVNNDNNFWDMTVATTNSIPATTFVAVPEDGNGLFRIRSQYEQTNTFTVTPDSFGWNFVHEDNTTVLRPYSIKVYEIKWGKDSQSASAYTQQGSTVEITPTSENAATGAKTFTMKAGTRQSLLGWNLYGFWWKTYYEYEVVLVLGAVNDDDLESGDYSSNLTVSYMTGDATAPSGDPIVENYRLRGSYGASNLSQATYNFTIQSTDATYDVDLTDNETSYHIADINFNSTVIETHNSSPTANYYKNRYKIMISPFSQYEMDNSSVTENPYRFIYFGSEYQTRSEINTVYYNIYKNNNGGTFNTLDANHSHTYVVPVEYSTPVEVAGSGSNRQYEMKWILNGAQVFIKTVPPSNSTIVRASGLYYSNIYFYVISTM